MAANAQTMIYTVDLGDGRVADIEGPPGATPEQLQAVWAQSSGSDQGRSGAEDSAPIHFKSWDDVQKYRNLLGGDPETAHMSDEEWVQWFGRTRQAGPQQVTVGDRTWGDYAGLGARAAATGLDDVSRLMALGSPAFAVGKMFQDATGTSGEGFSDLAGLPTPATSARSLPAQGSVARQPQRRSFLLAVLRRSP